MWELQHKNNSPLASHSEMMFTPKAELGYNVSNNTSLRFELTSNPIIPSLNMLSSNVTMLTRDIYKKGNPHLKNGQDTRVTLMLNHYSKYIDLMMKTTYSYQSKAIYQYFYTDNNELILGYKNCKHVNSYGGFVMLQYKPFGMTCCLSPWLVHLKWRKYIMRMMSIKSSP